MMTKRVPPELEATEQAGDTTEAVKMVIPPPRRDTVLT